jgi:hypothetical protein
MGLVVNKTERAITVIDVLLSPGVPTEMPDEYFDHPSVEAMLDYGSLEEMDEDSPPPTVQEAKPKEEPKPAAKPVAKPAEKPPAKEA